MTYVAVLGTWAWPDDEDDRGLEWWQPTSAFAAMLRARGLDPVLPDDPFVWSGDLDGVPWLANGRDWEAGAANLAHYLRGLLPNDRNVIAHSHGGAVALFAARRLPIRRLLTIGTPARKEVRAAARSALQSGHLGAWLHVHDASWDWMGSLGALFDGQLRLSRAMGLPGMTDLAIPRIGHSGLLAGGTLADGAWQRHGLYDFLIGQDGHA